MEALGAAWCASVPSRLAAASSSASAGESSTKVPKYTYDSITHIAAFFKKMEEHATSFVRLNAGQKTTATFDFESTLL